MEGAERFRIVTIDGGKSIIVDENRRQKIRRFRGILGKTSEKIISWAIGEAEEL